MISKKKLPKNLKFIADLDYDFLERRTIRLPEYCEVCGNKLRTKKVHKKFEFGFDKHTGKKIIAEADIIELECKTDCGGITIGNISFFGTAHDSYRYFVGDDNKYYSPANYSYGIDR